MLRHEKTRQVSVGVSQPASHGCWPARPRRALHLSRPGLPGTGRAAQSPRGFHEKEDAGTCQKVQEGLNCCDTIVSTRLCSYRRDAKLHGLCTRASHTDRSARGRNQGTMGETAEPQEFESDFVTLRYSQVASENARSISLRERPAVYAWYRTLSLHQHAGTAASLRAQIANLLAARLSEQYHGRLGVLYQVSVVERGGALSNTASAMLDHVLASPINRQRLAAILETATLLQSPLYIGKARNLRRRTGDHLTGRSGLRSRLQDAGIPIDSCVLRFKYVNPKSLIDLNAAKTSDADAVVELIEELLTRLSPAAFVRRPG